MTISPKLRFEILHRDDFRCAYCGISGEEEELEVDHVHPKAKGGTDNKENLVTACKPCNRGKRDKVITSEPGRSALVGKCFHSFMPCQTCGKPAVKRQGFVAAKITDTVYLVQFFDWVVGMRSIMQLATLDEMQAWNFYEDDDAMNYEYHGHLKYQHESCEQ